MLPRWKFACVCAVSDGVPRRSLWVALVVGTILNLINQGDALLGASPVNWIKIMLTFLVPYAVSTYGAVSYRLGTARDLGANKDNDADKSSSPSA
jgi:hypothetical protein